MPLYCHSGLDPESRNKTVCFSFWIPCLRQVGRLRGNDTKSIKSEQSLTVVILANC